MKIIKYQDGRKVAEKEQSKKPFTLQIYQPTEFEKKNPEAARYLKYQQETANYHELERQRKAAAVQKEKEELQKKYGKNKRTNTLEAKNNNTNIFLPTDEQQALRFMQYEPYPGAAYEYTQDYKKNTPWIWRAIQSAKKMLPLMVAQHPDVYENTGIKRVGPEGQYYTGAYVPIKTKRDYQGNVVSVETPKWAKAVNTGITAAMLFDGALGGWKLLSPSSYAKADAAADMAYISRNLNKGIRRTNLPQETAYSQISKENVNQLFKEHPELSEVGTPELYGEYYNTIYPASKVKTPYAHGTNSNLSNGLASSTKQVNTGAPETLGSNDMYFNLQPEASLQYINGVNTPAGMWNKRYWSLKEILGKPYNNTKWQTEPIITLRQSIPNRAGNFSRVKNADGTFSGSGKLLEEYKAGLGKSNMSDAEFLEELGVKPGETFNDWVARNKDAFSKIYKEGNYPSTGLYHAKIDAKNPATVNGGSTYYKERGIWDQMKSGENDVLLHNNAANEFNSDVLVVKNVSPEKVNILGSAPDQEGFRRFVGGRYRTTSAPAEYTTIKEHPFYYDKNGKFIPSSKYHYRRGWGINEDALQTGVIRVPEGDYKTIALKKYPWLDNGNPFSTTLLNHTFPYFSKGSLWPAKFGREPADLIVIADNAKGAKWVKGGKWGNLLKDQKPSEISDRSTPLLNGETNKFPTERSTLARYNERTKRYEIQNNPSTKTYVLDAENGPTALPVGEEKEYLLMSPDEQHWHTLLTGRSYGKSVTEPEVAAIQSKKIGGKMKLKTYQQGGTLSKIKYMSSFSPAEEVEEVEPEIPEIQGYRPQFSFAREWGVVEDPEISVPAAEEDIQKTETSIPASLIKPKSSTTVVTSTDYVPSEELIQSLISYEGFLDRPSNTLDGVWTIGYGDTDKELNNYYLQHPGEKYTKEKAEKRLRERVNKEFLEYAKKYTPNWDKLTGPMKDSIISYIYNIGPGNYSKHYKFFEALKRGDYTAAAKEIKVGWNQKSKDGKPLLGIRKRRIAEQQAFLHPESTYYGQKFEEKESNSKIRRGQIGLKMPISYLSSLSQENIETESPTIDYPEIVGYQPKFTNFYEPQVDKETEAIIETISVEEPSAPKIPKPKSEIKTTPIKKGTVVFKSKDINVGNMQDVLDKLSDAGISVRVSSGVRKAGAVGKAGNRSHHVTGNALDITPGEGETFETIRQKIKANKELQQWFRDRGIGIIDETVEETKKKTGATGDHFHIGPDKWARREFETLFTKLGGKIPSVLLYSTKNPRN